MATFTRVLSAAPAYRLLGHVLGATRGRHRFVSEHVRPWPGARVLDIGCGPADIVPHLDGVEYVGFDASERYIATARRRYGDRASFDVGLVEEQPVGEDGGFDIVLAVGVMHHLDDEAARHLVRIARSRLVSTGRFVALEPLYADGQPLLARYLIDRDRGAFVRNRARYEELVLPEFESVTSVVRSDLLRLPYTHLVLECGAADEVSRPLTARD